MSDCPECGMRDDDWFLCRREPCAINKTKRDGDRIIDLERQIAELRAERDYWKSVHYEGIGKNKDLAKLHNEAHEAAEAENTRLRALPLKDEVERVLEQAKVVLQGEATGRTWYEQTAEALEDVDALLSRLQAGEQEGWHYGPYGYLIKPIGLNEEHWHLAIEPSAYPDEEVSVPLYADQDQIPASPSVSEGGSRNG